MYVQNRELYLGLNLLRTMCGPTRRAEELIPVSDWSMLRVGFWEISNMLS